jgi:broad specificity phosphatase PhoE
MSEPFAAARARVEGLAAEVRAELEAGCAPIVLLRHSIREPILSADLSDAMAAPLTAEGRALAAVLATALPAERPVAIRHSPVPRCEETARILADGLVARGAALRPLASLERLGASYVRDPDGVVARFATLGQRGFVQAWSAGQIARTIIDPPQLAGEELLAELLALHADGEPLDLHVSHDLTLVALLSLVAAVDHPGFPWPRYLDAVLLCPREGRLRVRYGAASYDR